VDFVAFQFIFQLEAISYFNLFFSELFCDFCVLAQASILNKYILFRFLLDVKYLFYRHLFEEYSSARQSVVLRQFQEALAKAEDLMEDPPRYLGDVLAWIHQASLSEVDALNIVLKLDGNSGKR